MADTCNKQGKMLACVKVQMSLKIMHKHIAKPGAGRKKGEAKKGKSTPTAFKSADITAPAPYRSEHAQGKKKVFHVPGEF